ncbi:hypothetical protein LZ30DRAFT_777029 [Colletotrichum cereale]|nr:hypothetical protein LZ30DRAFT_777029 [Colletotrichum cereale]
MSCDVRPVITSTKTLYVNPYETPPACSCPQAPRSRRHTLSPSDRCLSHGCCTLDVAVHRCARRCRNHRKYNRYVHAPSASLRHPSGTHHSRQPSPSRSRAYPHSSPHPSRPLPADPFASSQTWRRLRTFDRDPDFRAVESRDFRFALTELLDIGRVLLHAEAELDKARLRIERERARHCDAHGAACERVLREWECGWARSVREMVVGADDLALSAEVLADCWVRYVGLLRMYEGLGQRRVSGIVEDRGRGRKHRGETDSREAQTDKEARPWRYIRRESWDRKDRNGEGRREDTRSREGRYQPETVRRRHSVRFEDEAQPRRKSQDGSSDGKRHRSWWRF